MKVGNRKAKFALFRSVALVCAFVITSIARAEIVYLATSYDVIGYDSNGSNVFSWIVDVSPNGIAVDRTGNIFVSTGGSIEEMSTGGVVSTFASGLGSPTGLAFDNNGNLYVSIANNQQIDKIDTNGNVSLFSQIPVGGTKFFNAISLDSQGNLYAGSVTHDLADSIMKIDSNGNASTFVNNSVALGGTTVSGIACDAAGNVYVSYISGNLLKFTPDGSNSVFASGPGNGIAFDNSGNLFLSASFGEIDEFNSNGDMSVFVTGGNSPPNLRGIAVWDVPEPSSLLLAATGLLLLAAAVKRKRVS